MEETKLVICNNTFCIHNSEKTCLNDCILLDQRGICSFCEMTSPEPAKKYPKNKIKNSFVIK